MEGAARAASSAAFSSASPVTMQPFCAPFARRMRVRRRVSMSAMATTPWRSRKAGSVSVIRQLEARIGRSRMTRPAAKTPRDSTSSGLAPVLPMCG